VVTQAKGAFEFPPSCLALPSHDDPAFKTTELKNAERALSRGGKGHRAMQRQHALFTVDRDAGAGCSTGASYLP
jgi:hypothetical protein